jgi:hypothetical protein
MGQPVRLLTIAPDESSQHSARDGEMRQQLGCG